MVAWERFEWVRVVRAAVNEAGRDAAISSARLVGFGDATLDDTRVGTDVAWLHDPCTLRDTMLSLATDFAEDYGFSVFTDPWRDAIQVSRYRVEGRYDWHMDLGSGEMSFRKVSVVCELMADHSQSADGGGLEVFGIGDLFLLPGDVAVFPSFIVHRARAVACTVPRYSAALWLTGPSPFR